MEVPDASLVGCLVCPAQSSMTFVVDCPQSARTIFQGVAIDASNPLHLVSFDRFDESRYLSCDSSWLDRVMTHAGHYDMPDSDLTEELKRDSGQGSAATQRE